MNMETTLSSLLSSLTGSLESAVTSVPQELEAAVPNGISLLDIKNELFLSYVQNLVFLIILKLRHTKGQARSKDSTEDLTLLDGNVTKKLVELRLHLEKGVRPLEGRLKYQIDKLVRAADEASRSSQTKEKVTSNGSSKTRKGGRQDLSGSEDGSSEDGDSDSGSEAEGLPAGPRLKLAQQSLQKDFKGSRQSKTDSNGVYRPPRIAPVAMPTAQGREERAARRPAKSATLDEFIANELSSAPIAEASIGSNIVAGGRRTKSQRERQEDAERLTYEESNFVRLPKDSKKEKAKNGRREREGGFGGEEWRNLGAGLDRIEQLTKKRGGSANKLANSRKRTFTDDGPKSSGDHFGDAFARKKRSVTRHMKR